MNRSVFKQLAQVIEQGEKVLSSLSNDQREKLEKSWDVEHAYYSSALEGSRLDRKEFEKLAQDVR